MNSDDVNTVSPNFEKYGRLEDFNDGHQPECTSSPTKLLQYDDHCGEPSLQIYENVLPESLCNEIYNFTIKEDIPWGTYVSREEALNDKRGYKNDTNSNSQIQKLAVEAARHFIFTTDRKGEMKQISGDRFEPALDERVHGVQIWALPAYEGSSVPYHIDYAEYIRYTKNVIVPPLYAGTIQCTQYQMSGGTFAISLRGLDHYSQHGYKGKLNSGTENRMTDWSSNDVTEVTINNDWVSMIPYRYNQGILHSGSLPHLSGKVLQLVDGKRVIVGFNVFGDDVGQLVEDCPEHSERFRKMIKLHRTMNQIGNKDNVGNGVDVTSLKQNKGLARMLVLANRQRVKAEHRKNRQFMSTWIMDTIKARYDSQESDIDMNPLTVSKLLGLWEKQQIALPLATEDLHIQIHRLWKEGTLEVRTDSNGKENDDGLLSTNAILLYNKV